MNSLQTIKAGFCMLLPLLLAIPFGGCSSGTSTQLRDAYQAGYRAGQQDARMQPQSQPQLQPQLPTQSTQPATQSVTIVAPVRNPIVTWRLGLSLAQAIITAGFVGETDPTEIVIVRNGTARRVDFGQLLAGQDVPLMPGDTVQIR
jgi:hypothetical protein